MMPCWRNLTQMKPHRFDFQIGVRNHRSKDPNVIVLSSLTLPCISDIILIVYGDPECRPTGAFCVPEKAFAAGTVVFYSN